ncbi:glycosyltransferase family 39 protein [Actinomycetospora cinnamomea]|uniref:Dolichyl-phosphate-mannose-protein mannosyltransferase n=1 Tax=Actinomycetospora cinnamomea TaxID=663609 RepID=A0A2U1FQD5_9PSEU|nr:glycosyltransferase family 39 protein [Actinomycetospora cinnamomea]PVZ14354.1 dolichyl-phosphate-mannose-protein mannosyltransferase [Actinomycetospora cinnamomea]
MTATAAPATASAPPPVPRLARRPVGVVAGLVAAAHLAVAWIPGWWFDEALMLAIGRHHLDWGSVDQPPVAPLLAAATDLLAPGNVLVLRLPAIAATTAGVVLAALIARELGGDARAQTLTAVAQATGIWTAISGHWLTPYTLEPVTWLALGWLLVRWWRVREDRLLLALGVVVGVGAQTKFQVLLLAAVLLLAVAALGPRELLRRPHLWTGAGLAAAIAAPTLVWQALHGWPQLRMGPVVASEAGALYGGRLGVAVGLLGSAGVLGLPLVLHGLLRLLRDARLRDLRYLGVTAIVLYAVFVVTVGRPYYLVGLYGVLGAVGAVGLQHRREAGHGRRRRAAWPAGVLAAAAAVPFLALSVPVAAPTVGAEVAAATTQAYEALPPAQRAHTGVMAGSYIYAAFLDVHAAAGTLPPAVSSNRSYGWFPPPSDDVHAVLYVGADADELRPWFADVRPVGHVGDAGDPGARLWLATGRLVSWESFWPSLRHLDVG